MQKEVLEREIIGCSNGILCSDQIIDKKIQNHFSLPEKKVFIIPEAFHWEDYQWIKDPGDVKKKYDIWPLDPLVLFVGEFTYNYGFDILLNAIPKLLKNNPNLRFILVGNGELMWPAKLNARYLFFEHAVRLVGHKEGEDLQELFQAADIILIDLRKPHLTPLYNIYSHLVYSAGGSEVDSVIINGKLVMENRNLLTVDEDEVIDQANHLAERIKNEIKSI